jgi:predicted DNA-binding WGR domain protein
MSDEYVLLINQEGNSNKFYKFTVSNGNIVVSYGPIGKTQSSGHFCSMTDDKRIRSQLKQKVNKGYRITEIHGNNVESNPLDLNFRLAMDALTGAFVNKSQQVASHPQIGKTIVDLDSFVFTPGVVSPIW